MPDTGTVGPVTPNSSAAGVQSLRLANMTQLIVDELYGQQYEAAYRGQTFFGANQAVVATALASGLTATNTGGLVLNNPIGNTKNLVLRTVTVGIILAQTNAAVIGIGTGWNGTVAIGGTLTAIPISSALVGTGPASSAGLFSSASITLQATPVLARHIASVSTGALTVSVNQNIMVADLQGGIVIQPGGYVNIVSSAAGTASSLFFGYAWNEVPI